jgi:hypothetical protein
METWQVTGAVAARVAAAMPWERKIAATLRAICASPDAVGCRPPWICANFHRPVNGSMMIALGSAARAAVTIARSVR